MAVPFYDTYTKYYILYITDNFELLALDSRRTVEPRLWTIVT